MAAAIEEIRVDGEIEEALPADLQFLRKANTNGIIGWFVDKARWNQNVRCMSPIVWRLLEKRIREHPNEAREVDEDGNLPIHHVFWSPPHPRCPLVFGWCTGDEFLCSASLPDTTSHRTTVYIQMDFTSKVQMEVFHYILH
jgi:hypothetical protein